jgi:predicted  nucleic acid-binding Zn-ribbon protein
LDEKQHEADLKKAELNDIVEETEKEESSLLAKSLGNQKIIEERLLTAYKKIRKNARNGLAVVVVERDACGGCFNKIPPQRQLDIRIHKKIIVCEYCGRILVDPEIIQS